MATYKLISSVTVGSGGATTMTFSSIPQTYTDLVLKYSARGDSTGSGGLSIRFNTTTTNYSERLLYGVGAGNPVQSVATSSQTALVWGLSNESSTTANTFSNGEFYILNYTGSNNKSVSGESATENNANAANIYIDAGLWSNSAAITTITVLVSGGNFVQNTTAYLYGISNA